VLRRLAIAAVLAVTVAAPARALAHDTYVDRSDGSDGGGTNDCSHKATPCATLGRGISQAGNGDTVFVGGDPAPFTVPQSLGDKKSIVHRNFSTRPSVDTSGKTVIDTGAAASPALTVASQAGRIKGLTIRSETLPLKIEAKVDVTGDRFDEEAQIDEEIDVVSLSPDELRGWTIEHSTFVDPTPLTGIGAEQAGITQEANQQVGLTIANNRFTDFQVAIHALGEAVFAHDNTITGTHSANGSGEGILLTGDDRAVVAHNVLRDPDISSGSVEGVVASQHASFSRNRISGYQIGVRISDVAGQTDFSDDVFTGNAYEAILVSDSAPDSGKADAVLSNETLWDPGASQGELDLVDVDVKVDSTLIGAAGIDDFGDSSTCSIKFSRGPTKATGGDGCAHFQTTKSPKLESDHYHLKPGSPMIDAGNKQKPPRHAKKDIDGDKRVLDGTGNCNGKKRRDIGADEFRC
jgi:Right handed beta helix region